MPRFGPISPLIDLFLPPRCPACQKVTADDRALCPSCWGDANFITDPFCDCCGLPFETAPSDGLLCLDCAAVQPPFSKARSVMAYDDLSKAMILSFKHGDRSELAPTFAAWMYRCAPELFKGCDLIVPVPLHWRKLGMRRFNQSALIAASLSKISGVPVDMQLLKRSKHTPPQGHLSRMARQNNLKGVFETTRTVAEKTILLVDDVLTTGATVLNCTNSLLQAGAADIRVITLSRALQTNAGVKF